MAELSTAEKLFDLEAPLFSRDFIVVDLLPSLALVGSVSGLLMAGAPASEPNGADFTHALSEITGTSLVVVLAASVVLAIVMHPFRSQIRRLLTGAWIGTHTARLAERRRKHWVRLWKHANDEFKNANRDSDWEKIHHWGEVYNRHFPKRDLIAPTRLGNAYAALPDRIRAPRRGAKTTEDREPGTYRAAYLAARDQKKTIVLLIDDARLKIAASERYTIIWALVALTYLLLLHQYTWWMLLALAPIALAIAAYSGAFYSVIQLNHRLDDLFSPTVSAESLEQASERPVPDGE